MIGRDTHHAGVQVPAPGWVKGWLPVQSAFGGFGAYRSRITRVGRYHGLQIGAEPCEQVPHHVRWCEPARGCT